MGESSNGFEVRLRRFVPLMVVLFVLGLMSRVIPERLPGWYVLYAGDFLWAMLVYFCFRLVFGWRIGVCLVVAFLVTYSIEVSQLFDWEWLVWARGSRLGGLVLGFGFLWSDFLAYGLGILLGGGVDRWVLGREKAAL